MSKSFFIAAHDAAIARYLEDNPLASEADAYERTVDEAAINAREAMADRIDTARDAYKEGLIR